MCDLVHLPILLYDVGLVAAVAAADGAAADGPACPGVLTLPDDGVTRRIYTPRPPWRVGPDSPGAAVGAALAVPG